MRQAVTVQEAALITGRSPRAIYYWIEKGALPVTSRFIDTDDLFKAEALMASRVGRPRKNLSNVAQGK